MYGLPKVLLKGKDLVRNPILKLMLKRTEGAKELHDNLPHFENKTEVL